jgi:ABC-type transporter Mla MlaB component
MVTEKGRPAGMLVALTAWMDGDMVTVVVGCRSGPREAPALCERVGALLERTDAASIVCDVRALTAPDLGTVEALARLVLIGRRRGCSVRLRYVPGELRQLFSLVGLAEVAGLPCDLRLGGGGQAEQGEHARGVEERVDPGDPPV